MGEKVSVKEKKSESSLWIRNGFQFSKEEIIFNFESIASTIVDNEK